MQLRHELQQSEHCRQELQARIAHAPGNGLKGTLCLSSPAAHSETGAGRRAFRRFGLAHSLCKLIVFLLA